MKLLRSILMATNLKEFNRVAFDMAISMATHYEAELVLLHVLEKMPEPIDDEQVWKRLAWLRGKEQREAKRRSEIESARRSLLDKNINSALIRDALKSYVDRFNINEASRPLPIKEVIVAEGDVVEEILSRARKHDCSMIVMAAHEGLFGRTSVSSVLRKVLKKSTIPVLTVPCAFEKE